MIHVASSPAELSAALAIDPIRGSCVTIGNFDGVHIGHQALLAKARSRADAASRPLITMTFEPHPLEVLKPQMAPPRLTDSATRLRLLRAAGVDGVLLLPFTPELAAYEPEAFIETMVAAGLCAHDLLVGYDFSLGKGRTGTGSVLAALGKKLQYSCESFGPVLLDGEPVSSTRVRQRIRESDMPGAAALLGRPHCVRGEVVSGFQRGHDLGYPTANMAPPSVQLPPVGVYATWARLGIECFPAVTSVGHNPTFGGEALTIETHLIDFSRDIYGHILDIDFIQFIRGQEKFDGPEALVRQITADTRQARDILASTPHPKPCLAP